VPEAAEVLLDQMRVQVASQASGLDTLRTRATAVVSVAGLVAGLFAPHYLTDSYGVGIAALAAFTTCAILATIVLFPQRVGFSVPLGQADLEWVRTNGSNPDAGSMLALQTASTLIVAYDSNRDALGASRQLLHVGVGRLRSSARALGRGGPRQLARTRRVVGLPSLPIRIVGRWWWRRGWRIRIRLLGTSDHSASQSHGSIASTKIPTAGHCGWERDLVLTN